MEDTLQQLLNEREIIRDVRFFCSQNGQAIV
jgi:hypothetical protein